MIEGPAWLGIGAQRCGTTWFTALLSQHPKMDVAGGIKEHHWLYRYGLTQEWDAAARQEYRDAFSSDDTMLGEFTPYYMRASWIIDIVADVLPADAPILVLVRDPIDRFASALRLAMFVTGRRYKMALAQRKQAQGKQGSGKRKGRLRGLAQAATSASRVVVEGPPRPPREAVINKTWLRYIGSDVSWGGMYGAQLDMWTNVLPKERFMVIQYEKLRQDPQQYADLVWTRLGLDPVRLENPPRDSSKKRQRWVPDDYPEVVRALQQIYRPDAERLASQFDIDLALWKRTMS
ncbi:MAG: sulfotransferase [Actinobacteria bacterium]|nr:sulfotransferase [Actinomycetota bacterium]